MIGQQGRMVGEARRPDGMVGIDAGRFDALVAQGNPVPQTPVMHRTLDMVDGVLGDLRDVIANLEQTAVRAVGDVTQQAGPPPTGPAAPQSVEQEIALRLVEFDALIRRGRRAAERLAGFV